MLKDFIHLWPAYVHWARGNLKLATENFAAAVKLLENRMWYNAFITGFNLLLPQPVIKLLHSVRWHVCLFIMERDAMQSSSIVRVQTL